MVEQGMDLEKYENWKVGQKKTQQKKQEEIELQVKKEQARKMSLLAKRAAGMRKIERGIIEDRKQQSIVYINRGCYRPRKRRLHRNEELPQERSTNDLEIKK